MPAETRTPKQLDRDRKKHSEYCANHMYLSRENRRAYPLGTKVRFTGGRPEQHHPLTLDIHGRVVEVVGYSADDDGEPTYFVKRPDGLLAFAFTYQLGQVVALGEEPDEPAIPNVTELLESVEVNLGVPVQFTPETETTSD